MLSVDRASSVSDDPPPPLSLLRWQNNPVVGPWATTQNLSLEEQLKAGVRVLDFRCGYVGLDAQNYDHVADGIAVVHDKFRTKLSLREALESVKQFVQDHPR